MIYTRKLLNKDEVKAIRRLSEHLAWEDGSVSSNAGPSVKKLIQAKQDEFHDEICQYVFDALNADDIFLHSILALTTTTPIISKVNVGGYYKPHHDSYHVGDYSTTLFLNDPDTYEGGELQLYVDNQVKSFKPKAGHAVTYSTGTPHCVTEVTSGERLAAVFWTTSKVKDPIMRGIISDLTFASENLKRIEPASLEKTMESPTFRVVRAVEELLRRYGQS